MLVTSARKLMAGQKSPAYQCMQRSQRRRKRRSIHYAPSVFQDLHWGSLLRARHFPFTRALWGPCCPYRTGDKAEAQRREQWSQVKSQVVTELRSDAGGPSGPASWAWGVAQSPRALLLGASLLKSPGARLQLAVETGLVGRVPAAAVTIRP